MGAMPKGLFTDGAKRSVPGGSGGPVREEARSRPASIDDESDDDFRNVDEYEEGDTNMHKNHDAILLQRHPTGLAQQN